MVVSILHHRKSLLDLIGQNDMQNHGAEEAGKDNRRRSGSCLKCVNHVTIGHCLVGKEDQKRHLGEHHESPLGSCRVALGLIAFLEVGGSTIAILTIIFRRVFIWAVLCYA